MLYGGAVHLNTDGVTAGRGEGDLAVELTRSRCVVDIAEHVDSCTRR